MVLLCHCYCPPFSSCISASFSNDFLSPPLALLLLTDRLSFRKGKKMVKNDSMAQRKWQFNCYGSGATILRSTHQDSKTTSSLLLANYYSLKKKKISSFFLIHRMTNKSSQLPVFCDFCLILVHLVLRLGGLNNYNFYHDVNRGGLMRDVRDCDNTTTILKRARL